DGVSSRYPLDPADARGLASTTIFRRNNHMRSFVFAIALLATAAFVRAQDAASTPFLAKTPTASEETPSPSPSPSLKPKPKPTPTATAKPSPKATVKPLQTAAPETFET